MPKSPETPALSLEERERALLAREQRLEALERESALQKCLAERHLPQSLSSLLAPADPDDLPARLDRLQSVLEEAVNLRVRERLRRDPPQAPSVPPRSDEALRRLRAAMQLKN